ncbi:MAG: CHASE2 domain-containing protein [Leptolyngbya sp. SIO4C1]|nr:CHASE2 domain-containing protein [Leptolyngbya sp. SIO4C1]
MARQVTVQQILNNQLRPDWVQGRVVLIGTVAPSFKDYHRVPHQAQKLPGVEIHAHAVSHLLSAVLEGQPLINPWGPWRAGIWIVGWSLVGSWAVGRLRYRALWLGTGGLLLVMLGSSYGLFWVGAWVPVVAGGIAIVGSAVVLWIVK